MFADPGKIVRAEAGAGDDVESVFGEPRHREVGLDAAARVEKLRVGEAAGRLVDVVGADPVERAQAILAGQLVFGERRLVEDADRLAHMTMLLADGRKPVLPAHRIDVLRLDAFRREPVRPLPAELRAEHGAMRLQPVIERRDDARPAGSVFLMREADRVMLAIGLERAVAHPVAVAVQVGKAPDVDHPQVERRLAVDDPLRQHPAGAAARRDAERIEAGTHEHVGALRRQAEDEIAVRRETLRPVDHLLDAGGLQRRDARDRLAHMLFEMVPVVVEQAELPVVRHVAASSRPADPVRSRPSRGRRPLP